MNWIICIAGIFAVAYGGFLSAAAMMHFGVGALTSIWQMPLIAVAGLALVTASISLMTSH